QDGGDNRRPSQPRTGCDGISCLSFETSFPSGRLRMGRRSGEPLGGPPGRQLMVQESNLADAVSIFSGNPSASTQSDQDVGPLVLNQFCMRGRVRCRDRLFMRLGWISLSGVRVFVFHWAAPGGGTLDSGALHIRFRPGDVQLLWADQLVGAEHGLSQ